MKMPKKMKPMMGDKAMAQMMKQIQMPKKNMKKKMTNKMGYK